jgi:hypothetical protein
MYFDRLTLDIITFITLTDVMIPFSVLNDDEITFLIENSSIKSLLQIC